MAKINHLKLKKALELYSESYLLDVQATEEKMKTDGYTDEEIFQIGEAITNPQEESVKPVKASSKVSTTLPKYGKYKVEIKYIYGKDARGNSRVLVDEFGVSKSEIVKGELIREVVITQEQADILNEQSVNSKEGYYLIED